MTMTKNGSAPQQKFWLRLLWVGNAEEIFKVRGQRSRSQPGHLTCSGGSKRFDCVASRLTCFQAVVCSNYVHVTSFFVYYLVFDVSIYVEFLYVWFCYRRSCACVSFMCLNVIGGRLTKTFCSLKCYTVEHSLNVDLRAGYLSVRTAGGASARHWLKVRRINGLTYLLYQNSKIKSVMCSSWA